MTHSCGIKLLFVAVLLIGISIEISETRRTCILKFLNPEELPDKNVEERVVKDIESKKRGAVYWQWVCKDNDEASSGIGAANNELEEEEPRKRIRRGWGSWRRSSSSSSSRIFGGYRSTRTSSTSSIRRGSSRLGSRRTPSSARSSNTRSRSSSSGRGFWGGQKSQLKPKSKQKTNVKVSKFLDKVHTALDIVGMFPVVGNVADGINAGLHAARGNWADAALSAAAMFPGSGQAATASKLAKKSGKVTKGSSKSLKEFLERAVVTNTKKKGKTIAQTDEAYDVAKKIFRKETGVKPKNTGVTHARTKDRKYHLTVRDHSKTGPNTMDVKDMATGHVTKTRCLGGSCKVPKE